MKTLILLLCAACLIANIAIAGDDNTPKTKDGDKAWLFSLGGLSNLSAGNFDGGVGGKYYISEGNAVRLALGFGNSSTTIKYPGSTSGFSDEKVTGTSISVSPAYLHSVSTSGPVQAYFGFGASFAWGSLTDENPNFVNNNKDKISSTTFGVQGIAGVEWFAWSNVSFGAEYQLGYATTSGTVETTAGGTTTSHDTPTNNTFSLGSASSANLTLSVYW
jgi:opacity protein-like surface antigen